MRKKLSILLILVMLTAVLTPLLPPAVSEQGPLSLLTTEAEAASIKLNHSSVVIPMRMYKKLEVKGGMMDNTFIAADEVQAIASLPSKEVLIAQIAGAISGVARGLAVCINGVPSGLARAIQQIADQKAA